MSSGVPTTALRTCVKSLALKTLMPLNSKPLTTGASGSVGGVDAVAVVDAGAGVVGFAVGGGTAAVGGGAAVVAVLGGLSSGTWAGSGGGVGAAKRTQLIFLSLLSNGLGMAGLTGLGGYCTHWSKRLAAAGLGEGVWAGLATVQSNHPRPNAWRSNAPTPAVSRRRVVWGDSDGRKFICGATRLPCLRQPSQRPCARRWPSLIGTSWQK